MMMTKMTMEKTPMTAAIVATTMDITHQPRNAGRGQTAVRRLGRVAYRKENGVAPLEHHVETFLVAGETAPETVQHSQNILVRVVRQRRQDVVLPRGLR